MSADGTQAEVGARLVVVVAADLARVDPREVPEQQAGHELECLSLFVLPNEDGAYLDVEPPSFPDVGYALR